MFWIFISFLFQKSICIVSQTYMLCKLIPNDYLNEALNKEQILKRIITFTSNSHSNKWTMQK